MKSATVLSLAMAAMLLAGAAIAQQQSQNGDTTVIDAPPQPLPSWQRDIEQDSTLAGGSMFAFPEPETYIDMPDPCVFDPTLPGCSSGGFGSGTEEPPSGGGPGSGGGCAGETPPSNAFGVCAPASPQGWACPTAGPGVLYQICN